MKNQKYKKIIALISILAFLYLISSISSPFFNLTNSNSKGTEEFTTLPRLSDGEITLITPENKTYDHIMQGYYPATHGFENDENGEKPIGWNIIEPASTSVEVISDIDGHKKVLELQDNSGSEYPNVINSFAELSSGIIEFWIYHSNNDKNCYIYIYDDSAYDSVLLKFDLYGEIAYYDTEYHVISSYSANQWYNVKIEFDCSSGYFIYINDIRYGEFDYQGSPIAMDNFRVNLASGDSSYSAYIDAVGYSWDNYEVGSNIHEGLVVGFENSTNLDWMGYSLDNQNNITIFGNKTIPIPEKGIHSIQVFGNNSLGTMYHSEKRIFTVDPLQLELITPENKIYNKIMSGYYPATFGFDKEKIGADQNEIEFVDNYVVEADCSANISSLKNNHSNVLHLYDNNDLGRSDVYNNFKMAQTNGTVEFWVLGSDVTKHMYIDLRFGSSAKIRITFGVEKIEYFDGLYHAITTILDDKWYHVKIDFECGNGGYQGLSADTYFVYINGIRHGPYNFVEGVSYLDEFRFSTASTNYDYHYFIDAIGYSWDNYEVGSNLREGLLCNFESPTDLEWMGYSLDDKRIISVLGNKTISLPTKGTHSIQVFGEDTSGNIYQSEKRFFTVDPLPLDILTPENKTHTYLKNGYYPATYGFENQEVGTKDTEIDFIDSIGLNGHAEIVQEKDNHKHVLNYSLSADYESIRNNFDGQSKGVLEYWIYYTNTKVACIFLLEDNDNMLYLDGYNGNLRVYDGGWHTVGTYSLNEWYHYAISFDCLAGTWILSINNLNIGTFNFEGSPSFFRQLGIDGILNSNFYLDAISYSWDPYYDELRTNFNEGILVDVPDIDYEWMDLYVDGELSKQTLGSTSIPLLRNGSHTIKAFAQDIEGNIYMSEKSYFTLNLTECKIGKQVNIGSSDFFDPESVRFNDGIYDETVFGEGCGTHSTIHREDAIGVYDFEGSSWGTTGGVNVYDALRLDDNVYLFVEKISAGDCHISWGGYSNFNDHQYLKSILVYYQVMVDSFFNHDPVANNMVLTCYDSTSSSTSKTIASVVYDEVIYTGNFLITEGTLFNHVKNGDYIKDMKIFAEITTGSAPAWINIDYVDIYYYFEIPDINFEYHLNCSEYGFDNITEFSLNLDIIETVSGLWVNIWNYGTSQWVQINQISTSGFYSYKINTNADDYFNNDEMLRIRFLRFDYWDGRHYYEYRIKIDFIQLKIPPPDPPPNLNASQGASYVHLEWGTSEAYGAPVLHYNVYRSTTKGGLMELIANTTNTEFIDSDMKPDTIYYYEIRAFSVMGESFKSATHILFKDTSPPVWNPGPEDQIIELGDSFNYDVNADDLSPITYSIDDTTHFSIDSETGMIHNIVPLSVRDYWLEITATDQYGNNITSTIKITVQDTTDPVWNPEPEDQIVELGNSFNYDVNAEDLSPITYSIDDTTNFSIDSQNGMIHNIVPLSVRDYWLEITATDQYGNNITIIIKITVQDTTDPVWNPEPEDQTVELGDSFNYDVDAYDFSTLTYSINDTMHFSINSATGHIMNIISLLVGEYGLEITTEDTYGNVNTICIKIIVVDTTPPTWNPEPEDQFNEFAEQLNYDVNAEDLSTITYFINDTTYFTVNCETGVITNATVLPMGNYWITITAQDQYTNFISIKIRICVLDNNFPIWNPEPEDQFVELGDTFLYEVNADDLSLITYSINDTTNFVINSETGVITNATDLSIGSYWLEITAEDLSGNNITKIIKIDVNDNITPVWNPEPEDQIIELGDSFNYDVNADDLSPITYSIDDTTHFSIDSETGMIHNIVPLSVRDYWLEITATDQYGNNITTTLKITVQDTIDPIWNPELEDQIIELGDSFYYDVNAFDLSQITYFINNTIHFTINSETGHIMNVSFLSAGEYWLEITVEDQYGNYIIEDIKIIVEDTTNPTWNPEPTDQVIELGDSFYYDVNAFDLSEITYSVSDTIHFTINSETGIIMNITFLSAGEYWLEITAEDQYSNYITKTITIYIGDTIYPVWNPEPEDQNVEFGEPFNYTINAEDISSITYNINRTDFIIDQRGVIVNDTFLLVGIYWMEIYAEDSSGNEIAIIIKISVEDTTKPIWNPEPEDQNVELGDTFLYEVNADDLSLITYSINDTTNFVINSETGVITNATDLSIGSYWLEITAEDLSGNNITKIIKIDVNDNITPVWNPEPEDQIIEYGETFTYGVNAIDLSPLSYFIDDTVHFSIGAQTGVIINNDILSVGDYWLKIIAIDQCGNNVSKILKISVQDTINPVWNPIPEDQVVELGETFNYDVNADDLSTITYSINDTTHFSIDSETGIITNAAFLSVGNYWLEITAEDQHGNAIITSIKISVDDNSVEPPKIPGFQIYLLLIIILLTWMGLIYYNKSKFNLV